MAYLIGLLIVIVCLLIIYIGLLHWQLKNINKQLKKRLVCNTRQPVSVEFINRELNKLVININKSLKAEENLRLESVREEKRFKELIANISHDLRTPLTAIKGYQQLLEKGGLTDEQRKKLKVAQKYSEELGRLIEQFFEYAYIVNADLKVNVEFINLTNLVTECLAGAVSSFEERGLSLEMKENPVVFAHVDHDLTVRIVQNLIRNCISHSAGKVEVEICTDKTAVISFKNPVTNPDEIDTDRIFDRFYTGDRARSKSTGLGLSIVKLLAEQMGGRASADLTGNFLKIRVELPT